MRGRDTDVPHDPVLEPALRTETPDAGQQPVGFRIVVRDPRGV
jgi:hypothetical protein